MVKKILSVVAVALLWSATPASAVFTFEAFLSGLEENPPNASSGTGYGTVVLNDDQNQITVNESWSALLSAATVSHIHGPAGVGTNAAPIFTLSGVPSATSGAIPEQMFAITPTQVADLFSGLYYFNVHSTTIPGGEIRGQIVLVPEPSAVLLVGLGVGVVALGKRRKTS